ncbi:hypothetical protein OC844_002793 [Tilletia horrida]|nr:hypothetical protein OC844_002793 [Tilletia horrida]
MAASSSTTASASPAKGRAEPRLRASDACSAPASARSAAPPPTSGLDWAQQRTRHSSDSLSASLSSPSPPHSQARSGKSSANSIISTTTTTNSSTSRPVASAPSESANACKARTRAQSVICSRAGRTDGERLKVNSAAEETKRRSQPSLGKILAQRGVLTSTTISNYSKSRPSTKATRASDAPEALIIKAVPSATPKSRSHSDFAAKDRPISSHSRTSSAASDTTIRPDMFGSVSPRKISGQRKSMRDSMASIYTQISADEQDAILGSGENDGSAEDHTEPRTPSLSFTASSDRSSTGSAKKSSGIEYNLNPFGSQPLSIKQDVFGPLGIRKESNFNVVQARLGSIGGTQEMTSMASRFQEIEDLLMAGRENRARRIEEAEAEASPLPRPCSPSKPSTSSTRGDADIKFGAVQPKRVSIISTPTLPMAPPPRPPRAKSRNNLKKLPTIASSSAEGSQEDLVLPPSETVPKKRASISVTPSDRADVQIGGGEPNARHASLDGGARRMSEAQAVAESKGGSVLMTREQWEAEYLPRLIEQERRKLLEEQQQSKLKSARSTPSLSPKKREAALTMESGKTDGDGEERPQDGIGQGREARRRSQSPIKGHRSSPSLSRVTLPSPHTPKVRSRLNDEVGHAQEELPALPVANPSSKAGTPSRDVRQSPFKMALAAARTNRSEGSQSIGSVPDLSHSRQQSRSSAFAALEDSAGASEQRGITAANVAPDMVGPGDVPLADNAPSPIESDSAASTDAQSSLLLDDHLKHRGSVSSEASSAPSSHTSRSTPTLGIRLNDSLTNLAIADVTTDLMQDDQSLMSLYRHGDLSFDTGNQSLYRLLGGDGSGPGGEAARPRPASAFVTTAERTTPSMHTRQMSDRVIGDRTPRHDLTPLRTFISATTPGSDTRGTTPGSTLSLRALREQALTLPSPMRPFAGSPAKPRGPAIKTEGGMGLGLGMGVSASDAFLSSTKSQTGSPVKARLDSGASPEQAALPPLIINPKRKTTKEEDEEDAPLIGDESSASLSLLNARSPSGSFLLDEKMDETMLFRSNIGTFSAKVLGPLKMALMDQKSARESSSAKDPFSAPEVAPHRAQPEGTADAPASRPKLADAVFATPALPKTNKGIPAIPRPSLGSRVPSSGSDSGPSSRSSTASRIAAPSSSSSSGGSRPPISGGRPSMARSFSGERPSAPALGAAENLGLVTPLQMRRLPSGSGSQTRLRTPSSGSLKHANQVGGGTARKLSASSLLPARSATTPASAVLVPEVRVDAARLPAATVTSEGTAVTPGAASRARAEAALRTRASLANLPTPKSLRSQSSSNALTPGGIPKSVSAGNVAGSLPTPNQGQGSGSSRIMVRSNSKLSAAAAASAASMNSSSSSSSARTTRLSMTSRDRAGSITTAAPRPSLPTPAGAVPAAPVGGASTTSFGIGGSRLPMRGGSARPSAAIPRAPGVPF